jgi:hypothetical protein
MTGEIQGLANRPTLTLPRRCVPRNDRKKRAVGFAAFLARRASSKGAIMQNKANLQAWFRTG